MEKLYAIEISGGKPIICKSDDVVRLVKGTQKGSKLVIIGSGFINPAFVIRIRREWSARPDDAERTDPDLLDALGVSMRMEVVEKQIK